MTDTTRQLRTRRSPAPSKPPLQISAARTTSQPRLPRAAKPTTVRVDDSEATDDEEPQLMQPALAPRKRGRPRSQPVSVYTKLDEETESDVDIPDADEENDVVEYERTHTLIPDPIILPSGRPAVDRILAHRVIPDDWASSLQSAQSKASSMQRSSLVRDSDGSDHSQGSKRTKLSQSQHSDEAFNTVDFSSLETQYGNCHFLVTFKHLSLLHTAWLPLPALREEGVKMKVKLTRYLKDEPEPVLNAADEEEVINPEFSVVEKIIAVREARRRPELDAIKLWWPHNQRKSRTSSSSFDDDANRDGTEYLVKWSSLPYSDCTWERLSDFQDAPRIAEFEQHLVLPSTEEIQRRLRSMRPPPSQFIQLTEGTQYKQGNELRPWQVEGVSWLLFNWYEHRGSILADEMGLGKTVQVVAMINAINQVYCEGPFLIVVPLSTLPHWRREFARWTDLNVVSLQGSRRDRDIIRYYEWCYRSNQNSDEILWKDSIYKFHVCIATYESVLAELAMLSKVRWRVCVIDEAHRLKNKESKLFKSMAQFHSEHRVMLTGTPIQNNIEELWTLLHYLEPKPFPSLNSFTQEFGLVNDSQSVSALQQRLQPYLLRRMKEDVAKKIPKKEETIIEVELTLLQKQYYRAVLEKNRQFLNRGCKGGNVPKLINVVMQLRKVCSHPFLIESAEEKETEGLSEAEKLNALINASGKLVLVDKLLPKLQAGGHRVLIFSQLKLVLDLLKQYLDGRGYEYERIDGNIRGNERQAAIDRFCAPGSKVFVFLLSTRAGGLGINLATADTVIIFDSDWNPQNDMQAQARAHRIGQTQPVKVYRLITSKTYEMEMFKRASLKLGLDHAILKKMQGSNGDASNLSLSSSNTLSSMDKREVESLLKYGAYDLFNEQADAASKSFCEEDIDQILQNRTTVLVSGDINDDDERQPSTFSKANFTSSSSDAAVDLHAEDFWDRIIPDQRSAPKLMQRLDSGVAYESEANRTTFLEDLFLLVQDVIGLHQQGIAPANTAAVIELLLRVNSVPDDQFTEEERQQALEWQQEIERPRRVRRQIERWSDVSATNLGDSEWDAKEGAKTEIQRRQRAIAARTRAYTRRDRKKMIGAVINLSGLAAKPSSDTSIRPPHHSLDGLVPPLTDIWVAIQSSAALHGRSFDEFASFCLAFLGYCSDLGGGDEQDRAVFNSARTRLIAALPPTPPTVTESFDGLNAISDDANQSMDVIELDGDEPNSLATTQSLIDSSPSNQASLSPLTLADDSAASPSATLDASFLSLTDRVRLPPVARVQSSSVVESIVGSSPSKPAIVRSTSTAAPPRNRSPRTSTDDSTESFDPRTADFNSFPSMSSDRQFARHVERRVKKWSRLLELQMSVMSHLDQHVLNERNKRQNNVTGSEESGTENDSSGTLSESSKAAIDPTAIANMQSRFGSYWRLRVPVSVDRLPCWWWTRDDDHALLVGVSKHGTAFRDIENDLLLGFSSKLQTEPGHPNDDNTRAGCICNRPRTAKGFGPTKTCVQCQNYFHLNCLEQAREDETLRLSQFPASFKKTSEMSGAATSSAGSSLVSTASVVDSSAFTAEESVIEHRALRTRARREVDADADEDDEEAEKAAQQKREKLRAQGWLCDRCDAEFPADRVLEQRIRAICDAFDRRNRQREKQREKQRQVQQELARKALDISNTSARFVRLEQPTPVWNKKERTRFIRCIQLFGSQPSAFPAIRRFTAAEGAFKRKTDASLEQFANAFIAQCRYLVIAERREIDLQTFIQRKKELRGRAKELATLKRRIEAMMEKEKQLAERREKRKEREKVSASISVVNGSRPNGNLSGNESEEESENENAIECVCDGAVSDDFVVTCDAGLDGCRVFYHGQCVGVKNKKSLPAQWVCPNCAKQKKSAEAKEAAKSAPAARSSSDAESANQPQPQYPPVAAVQPLAGAPQSFAQQALIGQIVPPQHSQQPMYFMPPQQYNLYQPQFFNGQSQFMAPHPYYQQPTPYGYYHDPSLAQHGQPAQYYYSPHHQPMQYYQPIYVQTPYGPQPYMVNGQQQFQLVQVPSQPFTQPQNAMQPLPPASQTPVLGAPVAVPLAPPIEIVAAAIPLSGPPPATQVSESQSSPQPSAAPVVTAEDDSKPEAAIVVDDDSSSIDSISLPVSGKSRRSGSTTPIKAENTTHDNAKTVENESLHSVKEDPSIPSTIDNGQVAKQEELFEEDEDTVPLLEDVKDEAAPVNADSPALAPVDAPSLSRASSSLDTSVPREAAWKVRRKLYNTSAADMTLQLTKLLVEQQNEEHKLFEWNGMRIHSSEPVKPLTATMSAAGLVTNSSDSDEAFSTHFAHKALSRALLMDHVRLTLHQYIYDQSLLLSAIEQAPRSLLPIWWTPYHDWATMLGCCDHGLGNIESIISDARFTAIWSSASSTDPSLRTTDSQSSMLAYIRNFLRDKSPLLRRMNLVCNFAMYGNANSNRSDGDDLLDWLVTSRKEKSEAFKGSAAVSQYNATSSNTLAALNDVSDGSTLLSMQAIQNWARLKEISLRMTDSSKRKREQESKPHGQASKRARRTASTTSMDVDNSDDNSECESDDQKAQWNCNVANNDCDSQVDSSQLAADRVEAATAPHRSRPRTLQRDNHGNFILPVTIKSGVTLHNLGTVVDRRHFYTDTGFIWPVGFQSSRLYYSLKEPERRVEYTSEIRDGGDHPLFVVTASDDPGRPFTSRTASGAWSAIIKQSKRSRQTANMKVTQSGPQYFGIGIPVVRDAIASMPAARAILERVRKPKNDSEKPSQADSGAEVAVAAIVIDNKNIHSGKSKDSPVVVDDDEDASSGGDADDVSSADSDTDTLARDNLGTSSSDDEDVLNDDDLLSPSTSYDERFD